MNEWTAPTMYAVLLLSRTAAPEARIAMPMIPQATIRIQRIARITVVAMWRRIIYKTKWNPVSCVGM
ncbi:hypothetical protein DPMN_088602 [Dreissena polymorpha]|uniref:Uncharacterized protein n=1 Tax=Dreissena polymorpha TaxID=45954 RepID=A0A9D4QXF1_DREPO|nr:hypothetical protein DPMN_088602 [Dreissena polymorpha]